MTARIIRNSTVEQVSDREFFARLFGSAPRTRAEREAEWNADCEHYADMIEAGGGWSIPPPCLADARRIVAERAEALTEVTRDTDPETGNPRIAA